MSVILFISLVFFVSRINTATPNNPDEYSEHLSQSTESLIGGSGFLQIEIKLKEESFEKNQPEATIVTQDVNTLPQSTPITVKTTNEDGPDEIEKNSAVSPVTVTAEDKTQPIADNLSCIYSNIKEKEGETQSKEGCVFGKKSDQNIASEHASSDDKNRKIKRENVNNPEMQAPVNYSLGHYLHSPTSDSEIDNEANLKSKDEETESKNLPNLTRGQQESISTIASLVVLNLAVLILVKKAFTD